MLNAKEARSSVVFPFPFPCPAEGVGVARAARNRAMVSSGLGKVPILCAPAMSKPYDSRVDVEGDPGEVGRDNGVPERDVAAAEAGTELCFLSRAPRGIGGSSGKGKGDSGGREVNGSGVGGWPFRRHVEVDADAEADVDVDLWPTGPAQAWASTSSRSRWGSGRVNGPGGGALVVVVGAEVE
jgi:hypothetical protein